jgi:hypothetical protein
MSQLDCLAVIPVSTDLTALMILLFLGSWRSTLIVATSIPLSILTSIVGVGKGPVRTRPREAERRKR